MRADSTPEVSRRIQIEALTLEEPIMHSANIFMSRLKQNGRTRLNLSFPGVSLNLTSFPQSTTQRSHKKVKERERLANAQFHFCSRDGVPSESKIQSFISWLLIRLGSSRGENASRIVDLYGSFQFLITAG